MEMTQRETPGHRHRQYCSDLQPEYDLVDGNEVPAHTDKSLARWRINTDFQNMLALHFTFSIGLVYKFYFN